MTDTRKFKVPVHVVSRDISGETIVLDMAAGGYFGLNPVGAQLWQGIVDGHDIACISARMVAEYDVSEDRLTADIEALLGDLLARELIKPLDAAA